MGERDASEELLDGGLRNRIIEYLELAASSEKQRDYERKVPIAWVPNEMIQMWADWIGGDDIEIFIRRLGGVLSDEEREAVRNFHAVWSDTLVGPDPIPSSIDSLMGTADWERFMRAARDAIKPFLARDRSRE